MTLDELKNSSGGIITEMHFEKKQQSRFTALGIIPGVRIKKLRGSPLGSMSEYIADNCRIALRRKDAAKIIIERDG